jgi:nucleotide-binding universal stress UspA family protein
MTTVLVGVDASERSLDALAFARQIAAASGACLLVANVFPDDDDPSRAANARALVGRLSTELTDLGTEHVRTAVVACRSAAHGLRDLALTEQPDLIVVGSSHVGTVGRVTPGSTGERLLHGAPCPVAIVPKVHPWSEPDLRRVGVADNASAEASAALQAAVEVARATGAHLQVIRVLDAVAYGTRATMGGLSDVVLEADREEQARAALEAAVAELPPDVDAEAVFLTGEPARELAARTANLDLLITGSRGYGPLRAVVAGGVTGRVLRDAACPVIVLPRGVASPLGDLFGRRGVGAGVAAEAG